MSREVWRSHLLLSLPHRGRRRTASGAQGCAEPRPHGRHSAQPP